VLTVIRGGKEIAKHKVYKRSAAAEMGNRVHNRHGARKGEAAVPLSRGGDWVV